MGLRVKGDTERNNRSDLDALVIAPKQEWTLSGSRYGCSGDFTHGHGCSGDRTQTVMDFFGCAGVLVNLGWTLLGLDALSPHLPFPFPRELGRWNGMHAC